MATQLINLTAIVSCLSGVTVMEVIMVVSLAMMSVTNREGSRSR